MDLFYVAFLDLTSCRGTGYGTEGPIPWTAMHLWAGAHQLDAEQTEDLYYHVQHMDEVYLKFKAKKLKDGSKAPPTKGKK